jgi:hypothetical protein
MLNIKEVQGITEIAEEVHFKYAVEEIEENIRSNAIKGKRSYTFYDKENKNNILVKKLKKYFKALNFKCSITFIAPNYSFGGYYALTISW